MQLVVRVEPDLERIVEEVEGLVALSATVREASRSVVLRAALRRGLEQMKTELSSGTKKRR